MPDNGLFRRRTHRSRRVLVLCLLLAIPVSRLTAAPCQDQHPDVLVPQAFAAVADGQTDDAAALQALFDEALRTGRPVFIPAGEYFIGRSLQIYSGMVVSGAGPMESRLLAPNGLDFDLLQLDAVEDVLIENIGLIEKDYANRGTGAGLAINGNSRRVRIENVRSEGFRSAFSVGRDDGGVAEGIVFNQCYAEGSRTFGFDINNTRQLLIENCESFRHRLDGIKLRRLTYNVTIVGGESSHNGIDGPNGNGVDAYAGGTSFTIRGLVARHNNGSGLYFKTGPLSLQDFGTVTNINLYDVEVSHNTGSGIDINRSGGDQLKQGQERLPPLLGHVAIFGGTVAYNTRSGIYIRGRMVSIVGTKVLSNARSGIQLNNASDIYIGDVQIAGNGTEKLGAYPGISVNGERITIKGGSIDGLKVDATEDATPVQRVAIDLGSTADSVVIDEVMFLNWGSGQPLRSRMAADASLLVRYGDFPATTALGGEGSTLIHAGIHYLKTTPVRDAGGWLPLETFLQP